MQHRHYLQLDTLQGKKCVPLAELEEHDLQFIQELRAAHAMKAKDKGKTISEPAYV